MSSALDLNLTSARDLGGATSSAGPSTDAPTRPPIASTSSGTGLEPKRSMSSTNRRSATTGARRKGKGRGRQMMLKIFYSLNSPRFSTGTGGGNQHLAPSPFAAQTATGLSPDFLAVLDPALAPSPESVPSPASTAPQRVQSSASQYSYMARLATPVWVQMVRSDRRSTGAASPQFGRVTLKTCLSAICISRPELVIDSTKDYSVSATDPYESMHQQQQATAQARLATEGHSQQADSMDPLVEGKGMLSWALAEKKEGTTLVCGRVTGSLDGAADDSRPSKRRRTGPALEAPASESEADDSEAEEPEETLEVYLQLTEREAFTQGQFLHCLRSYHNPISHIQSQLSELDSSPPKRREAPAVTADAAVAPAIVPFEEVGASTGDPVKPKPKRPRTSHPTSLQPSVMSHPAPFATSSSIAASIPAMTATSPETLGNAGLQDPRTLALLTQLLPSLSGRAPDEAAPIDSGSIDASQAQALLPAIQTLAKYCGVDLVAPTTSSIQRPTAPPAPTASTVSEPVASSSAGPPAAAAHSHQSSDRFVPIDTSELTDAQRSKVGKQNPRDPKGGCTNCKRRKSTTWHEKRDKEGLLTSVCNACGVFFNKNGYHRTKAAAAPSSSAAGPRSAYPGTSPPRAASKNGSARPLQGRLTATCEADLVKRKAKNGKSSPTAGGISIFATGGLIPPLSPSKHIGPRSPSLSFAAAFGQASPQRQKTMSSPGRSPRMRYRNVSNPFAATSPVRGLQASRSHRKGEQTDAYESDGDARGPNPLEYGNLFGMDNGSPSPVRTFKADLTAANTADAGDLPSYLLTASPGTALDRILNETNIGSISAFGGGASGKRVSPGIPNGDNGSDFSFFLQQPGSPTAGKGHSPSANKENARPPIAATSSTDPAQPATDADSLDPVISSLRREFNNRLSSNALTAPSSPAPSSPCVLPRTSTATPGSKGKAPQSCGRPAPSIIDSFLDGLVPAFGLDDSLDAGGRLDKTPASESDCWSPLAAGTDHDATIRIGEGQANPFVTNQEEAAKARADRPVRRAACIPAHLLAPSDATDSFDLGSLPPSSPPMLPSDAFPTPSDFEGVTPSADGGDAHPVPPGQQSMLHAVAHTVASEPNADTRRAMISLLQSLRSGAIDSTAGLGPTVETGDANVQLDRDTVNQLLNLISAHGGPEPSTSTKSPMPSPATDSAHGLTALNAPAAIVTGDQQMAELYHDLFANPPF